MFMPQPPQATPVGETVDQGLVMPSGSNSRSLRKSISGFPLILSTMAASRCVAPESYLKPVPGSRSILFFRRALTQSPAMSSRSASVRSAPRFIVRRSRTRTCRRFSDGSAGAASGKRDTTRRSRSSLPSSTRKPTAVDVKLFECE